MKKHLYTITLLLFCFANSYAQSSDEAATMIEDMIEDIAETSDEELDYSTLFDDLMQFYNDPLDLNTATIADLEKIPFLSDIQIDNLLAYIHWHGRMLTIYELLYIEGFDRTMVEKLIPFVTIETRPTQEYPWRKALKYGQQQVFARTQYVFENRAGYNVPDSVIAADPDKNRYLGDPFKYYLRYRFAYKTKISAGFTAEKDPGEQFFGGAQRYGFDYYTAHLQINDFGRFKTIALGDYQVQFGQGLTAWAGMGVGKSSYVTTIRKKGAGVKRYGSTDENRFMRGAAATMNFNKWRLTGFVSYHRVDGNIAEADTLEETEDIVSALQNTGLHATPSEIADRNAIGEFAWGGNVNYGSERYKIGTSFIGMQYNKPIQKTPRIYNGYEFSGNTNYNGSIDYQFMIHKFYFFGEAAISRSGGKAFLNGALFPLAPQVSLAALHRYYEENYHSYLANAFAEGSSVSNERGFYLGAELHPYRLWTVSAYFDTYTFPWMRSRAYMPSSGFDYLVKIDYAPARKVTMYWRFKQEIKAENMTIDDDNDENETTTPLENTTRQVSNVNKMSVRYHVGYELAKWLTMKSRVEWSRYQKGSLPFEYGYLAYQDIVLKPQKLPFQLSFRFAVFDSPFNARIYAYETDVLYGYSIPAHIGRGVRTYLTARYMINDRIDMWFRIAQFNFADRTQNGSGLTLIDNNTRTEAKLQIRIRF